MSEKLKLNTIVAEDIHVTKYQIVFTKPQPEAWKLTPEELFAQLGIPEHFNKDDGYTIFADLGQGCTQMAINRHHRLGQAFMVQDIVDAHIWDHTASYILHDQKICAVHTTDDGIKDGVQHWHAEFEEPVPLPDLSWKFQVLYPTQDATKETKDA